MIPILTYNQEEKDMYKDLLPIGSIVILKGGNVKLMITGRILSDDKEQNIYDYVGCIYPIGITAEDDQYFFNRDGIERVLFIGYQDEDELTLKKEVFDKLGALKIENGQIVSAE